MSCRRSLLLRVAMPYARLEIVCAAFIIFILYNRSVYKYNALTKYSPIPGYVGTQENVSHNVEASLDNKPDINEETGKRQPPDEYDKLLYGVNISELQDRSYTQVNYGSVAYHIRHPYDPKFMGKLQNLTAAAMAFVLFMRIGRF